MFVRVLWVSSLLAITPPTENRRSRDALEADEGDPRSAQTLGPILDACLGADGECTQARDCPFGECPNGHCVGCNDPDCCDRVCRIKLGGYYCCDVCWDQICADLAELLCGPAPPTDDSCARAKMIELNENGMGSAFTPAKPATVDRTDPGFGCYVYNPGPPQGILHTVWYKFTATQHHVERAEINTCLSAAPVNDTLVAVYAIGDLTLPDWLACDSLIPIGCGDDAIGCGGSSRNARVCVGGLTPGRKYYIQVASKEPVTQDGAGFTVTIFPQTCEITNDYCPSATCAEPEPRFCITDGTLPFDFTPLAGPAYSLDLPVELCIPTMTTDMWFEYVATCTGELQVKTCGTTPQAPDPDTNLVVYGTCSCPPVAGPTLACSTDAGGACGNASEIKNVDVIQSDCYKIRLADSAESLPAGNLTVACVAAACPGGALIFVDPPDEVVDARRPHNRDDANLLFGIQTITAQHTSGALSSCFSLCETGNSGSPNSIQSVVENPPGTYTIRLARPISPGEKTNLIYTNSHVPPDPAPISLRLVSSPGNIAADAVSGPNVLDLVNALNGTQALVWGRFSGDVDGSSKITGADVVEAVDVLKGYGAYAVWDGTPNELNNAACLP